MVSIVDKSFDVGDIPKYDLNIKIGHDYFVANCLKSKSQTHLAICEKSFGNGLKDDFQITAFIKTLQSCEVKISKKYNKTVFNIAGMQFALVPAALYDETLNEQYLSLNSLAKNHTIKSYPLANHDLVIVYALPIELNQWIEKIFPKAKVIPSISVSINSVAQDFYAVSGETIAVNLHKNYFELLQLKNGKITFCNCFQFVTNEDVLYYILFVFKQLNIDPIKTAITLLGNTEKGGELHQLLSAYFDKITFGSRNKNIKVAPELSSLPHHKYYDVFNQNL